jgi:hypothetical protein
VNEDNGTRIKIPDSVFRDAKFSHGLLIFFHLVFIVQGFFTPHVGWALFFIGGNGLGLLSAFWSFNEVRSITLQIAAARNRKEI